MAESTVNESQFNPSYSKIAEIWLIKDGENDEGSATIPQEIRKGLQLLPRGDQNVYCQFEKLEMLESIFEVYPSGSLIVRDTSDIITYIKNKGYDTIWIKRLNDTLETFSITSTSYLNNAAAETEETFVSINFSNHYYKLVEQQSLINIVNIQKPEIDLISKQVDYIQSSIVYFFTRDAPLSEFPGGSGGFAKNLNINRTDSDPTDNYSLYLPFNTLESRVDIPETNIFQYISYLSSYAIPSKEQNPFVIPDATEPYLLPRFMFWTGWHNSFNFKYFYQNCETVAENTFDETKRYMVYDSDSPELEVENSAGESKVYNKIYNLSTKPADQFMSKRYHYIRKTPKFLNNKPGNTYSQLSYQYQDEGQKYDYEICTSEGITGNIPIGSNELIYKSHWGHYDSYTSLDKVSDATHIGHNFGYQTNYLGNTFMGITRGFLYVDCPEMWKNQFDLTPLNPNLNYPKPENVSDIKLAKVIDIRYDTFLDKWNTNKGIDDQLAKIRQLENQNFVSYVLCCLKEQKEETFFAALLGRDQSGWDPYYNQRGVNGEPLKYRYSWAKLKLIDDTTAIKLNTNQTESDWKYTEEYEVWSTPENRLWVLDIGDPRIIDGKPNGEWSGWPFGDLRSNFAINISERTNWYSASGLTYSNFPLFPFPGQGTTGAEGGYYSPGWHAQSVLDEGFENIKYRPIGHSIGDLTSGTINVQPTGITLPPIYSQEEAEENNLPVYTTGVCNYREFKKLHIVKMHKTPVLKLLLDSNITDQDLLNFYNGKFIYWFDAQNIMDGPCD